MPRIVETTLYKYSELSEKAKARARDWWRDAEAQSGDSYWAESTCEDFAEVLKACGYDVATMRGRRMPAIYWYLNPHGAGFEASWSAARVTVGLLIADRPVTWQRDGQTHTSEHNARLVPLLHRMQDLALSNPDSYGSVRVNRGPDISETEWQREDCRDVECTCDAAADEFGELSRELAAFLAWSLDKEYEWYMGDECVGETIEANGYEFTEDGNRA